MTTDADDLIETADVLRLLGVSPERIADLRQRHGIPEPTRRAFYSRAAVLRALDLMAGAKPAA
jgi:hypothetical protein